MSAFYEYMYVHTYTGMKSYECINIHNAMLLAINMILTEINIKDLTVQTGIKQCAKVVIFMNNVLKL